MKSKITKLFLGISLLFILSGCAGIMNPYESEFSCKGKGSVGKCATTPEIYAEEVGKKPNGAPLTATEAQFSPGESAYHEAEMNKVTKLLKQPVTPVAVPPAVMRTLILPYQGENGELNMPQFVYMMIDKPKWIMGDYLVGQEDM